MTKQGWISVEDGLPDVTQQRLGVLVWCNGISVGRRVDGRWLIEGELYGDKVTHWMPLPDPPETDG